MKCLVVIALLAACGGSSAQHDHGARPALEQDASCPLEVPGTSIAVEDTPTGAALVFVTTGSALDVRSRAARLADMHNNRNGAPTAMGMMFSSKATATASEIDNGARVDFKADDAAGVQSELRMHAQHLTGGSCKM